jgi:hypothetical protein
MPLVTESAVDTQRRQTHRVTEIAKQRRIVAAAPKKPSSENFHVRGIGVAEYSSKVERYITIDRKSR